MSSWFGFPNSYSQSLQQAMLINKWAHVCACSRYWPNIGFLPQCKHSCWGIWGTFLNTRNNTCNSWKANHTCKSVSNKISPCQKWVKQAIRGAGMAQWWEHSPPTNVTQVWFPDSASYVGWVCCWFSSLLQEVFLRVLRFSPLLKNQNFQIPIRSGLLFKHFIMSLWLVRSWKALPVLLTLNLNLFHNIILFILTTRWTWQPCYPGHTLKI